MLLHLERLIGIFRNKLRRKTCEDHHHIYQVLALVYSISGSQIRWIADTTSYEDSLVPASWSLLPFTSVNLHPPRDFRRQTSLSKDQISTDAPMRPCGVPERSGEAGAGPGTILRTLGWSVLWPVSSISINVLLAVLTSIWHEQDLRFCRSWIYTLFLSTEPNENVRCRHFEWRKLSR